MRSSATEPESPAPTAATERAGRPRAFAWVVLAYAVAAAAAVAVAYALRAGPVLLTAALADLAATLVVFGFSVRFDNSSFYDPYWSVAPLGLLLFFALAPCPPCLFDAEPTRALLVALLVAGWGVRLTWNWARGWRGLRHEDWRYADLRRKTGRLYWPASLFGLHLMPTAMVFGGCLAVHVALRARGAALGWLDVAAAGVTVGAIALEMVADEQLRRFVRSRPPAGAMLERGLWAYSRHPNYLGEILFWWGLSLFALAAEPGAWWVLAGPAAITLLFLGVSLPLIEQRMRARRPGYADRQRRVSLLVPWFPKS